ncbi:MAG: DNA-3-methyladenine glycosylase 2 family protein [Armatimonadota bacterium]|nr:DNA-3-methyladenine glycosylase 2 family protein [Armatimonadota bacterium]MDW8156491.1 DNA-3-methyladenine glycosylase 2 family protein [Armatimonadota bacterium]
MREFLLHIPGLHLARTLQSGQAFRWCWRGPVAEGVVGGGVWRLRPVPGGVVAAVLGGRGCPGTLRRYLVGWGPLGRLEAALARDPVLARVLPHTRGISILAQDPWEVLATFVISQNNNIPKIACSVARLCEALGEPIGSPPVAWTFPSPEAVAEAPELVLREALLGYRAPYLREAARRVARGDLDLHRLRALPTDEARRALLELPGIGEKVADCVLLFGLGHRAVFPVDVWVRRAVQHLYFGGKHKTPRALRGWALDRFGELAGLAQQHLYQYGRTRLRRPAAGWAS